MKITPTVALAIMLSVQMLMCQPARKPAIVSRPLPFGERRKALTLDYIHQHYDEQATSIQIQPRMIVIHWSATRTFDILFNTFAPDTLPSSRTGITRGGKVNVSSHFGIERDGTIYHFMPETWMARHTIGLNRQAIGIENVGGPDAPLTEAQLRANAELVRYLKKTFPGIEYLIGHHEYQNFRETPLWQEKDPSYFTVKQDPGDEFMMELRKEVHELGLKGTY